MSELIGRTRNGAGVRQRAARAAAVLAALAVVSSGCSSDWDAAPVFDDDPEVLDAGVLRSVADCDQLVRGTRSTLDAAIDRVWAARSSVADGAEGFAADEGGVAMSEEAPAASLAPATTSAQRSADTSTEPSADAPEVIGTNVQEAEVDEADLVKTDGRRIVTITGSTMRITELDGEPAVDGVLDLTEQSATEMFLRGDEAVVIGGAGGAVAPTTRGGFVGGDVAVDPARPAPLPEPLPEPEPLPFPTGVTITTVSLEDPTNPVVTDTAALEGDYVSARMVDDTVRVVVRGGSRAVDEVMSSMAESTARAAVADLTGDDLLPRMVSDGEVRTLGGCGDVMLLGAMEDDGAQRSDSSFAPEAMSTVTTVTVGEDLEDLQPVTIQGNAETVYASTSALYVTSSGWDEGGTHTAVHRLELPADGPAAHTGSGRVPGRLLNQFSLSEHDGALRVVTTLDGSGVAARQGRLTVLDTEGDSLDEVGHLDGLGPDEEVKSVRFMGDRGYVVTFRTTDPLYALDLSDHGDPRLLGELKIPGFSEYLHPVGDGLLLGVGREADPTTGMESGAKVSLFDVSDPQAMAEVDQVIVPGGWSPVGSDHRAFLWDGGRSQAVVPMERPEAGGVAMVLRVGDGTLDTVAELRHGNEFGSTPIRSLVVGDDLWTVSTTGLGRTSADSPGTVDRIPF